MKYKPSSEDFLDEAGRFCCRRIHSGQKGHAWRQRRQAPHFVLAELTPAERSKKVSMVSCSQVDL